MYGGTGTNLLKRLLVVFQFTISQALIICVLIIIEQMDYLKSKPLGFDKDAIVVTHIPIDSLGISKIAKPACINYSHISGIDKVSFSYASPMDDNIWNSI